MTIVRRVTGRRGTLRLALAAGALAALALAGCSSSSGDQPAASGDPAACTPAQTGGLAGGGECVPTAPATGATTPTSTDPATSAAPLEPQEVEGDCPYLTRQEASNLEGNMVGRVTVVTTDPPGCNFYFAYGDGHRTLQISTQRFTDPIDAYNAMVVAAQAGANADPFPLGDGGVLFQVAFYDPDPEDWAAAFVKGGLLVVVNTTAADSYNARVIAETIFPLIT